MDRPVDAWIGMAVLGIAALSLLTWYLRLTGVGKGLWSWQRGPRLSFALLDLLTALLLLALCEIVAAIIYRWSGGDSSISKDPVAGYALAAWSRTIAMVLWCGLIFATRPRIVIRSWRAHRRHFFSDLRRVGVGFLLWVPPVLVLQSLLASWLSYEHPTLETLRELHTWQAWLPLVFVVVFVAPVSEELLFRGVLLGWFDRLLVERPSSTSLLFLPDDGRYARRGIQGEGWRRWGAIVASSLIFAGLHVGNGPEGHWFGPDLLPLFLLAIALGWSARQTGRLTPAIGIHMLLNGLTVTLILLGASSS